MALAEDTDPLALPVRVIHVFYDREEGPYLESGLIPLHEDIGERFRAIDLAICMEPTDGTIQMGCTGTLHATIRFEGRRAHSARPSRTASRRGVPPQRSLAFTLAPPATSALTIGRLPTDEARWRAVRKS